MGSTSKHRPAHQSTRDFVADMFDLRYEVLDVAIVERATAYVALRNTATGLVKAVVVLIGHTPNSYFNIWYKDMTEAGGPGRCACPRRILDLLSPVEDLYGTPDPDGENAAACAAEWRARCHARLAHRQAVRATCKAGQPVTFGSPVHYNDGTHYTELVWTGKSNLFRVPADGGFVRVRSWRDRVVVPA